MRITHVFTETSKNALYMHYDYEHGHGTIYTRYERPSQSKIRAWHSIEDDYNSNEGVHQINIKGVTKTLCYNHDLKIVGASSHFFSTIASFEDLDTGEIWLVKETHVNTYACKL